MALSRVALVTGASSGSGRAIAARLARDGHTVFGTCRQPQCETLDGFTLLPLDVTVDESVAACVAAVLERAGRLDVLVNNVGADITAATEELSMEDFHWLFEINFFGAVRMVKAVLPQMRALGGGQIINVSSALGRVGLPIQTAYAASKHALEGFTASLRHEVMPFNIRVSIIEPGFFQSDIRQQERRPANLMPLYDSQRRAMIESFDHAVQHGADAARLGDLVAKLMAMKSPGLRYPVLWEAHAIALATRFAPYPLLEMALRWIYHLDEKA